MTPSSIAFIDDHPVLRDGLVSFFSTVPEFRVVASGCCASDAVAVASRHRPDILVIDLQMPGNAFDAIARIRQHSPSVVILAFTASDSVNDAIAALEAGANGYVLKGSTAEELIAAITAVKNGETFITQSLASKVILALRQPRSASANRFPHLSVREEQIVKLLMRGYTNKMIACQLSISEKTVKHYMTLLMQKMDVRNRLEVVAAAHKISAQEGNHSRLLN